MVPEKCISTHSSALVSRGVSGYALFGYLVLIILYYHFNYFIYWMKTINKNKNVISFLIHHLFAYQVGPIIYLLTRAYCNLLHWSWHVRSELFQKSNGYFYWGWVVKIFILTLTHFSRHPWLMETGHVPDPNGQWRDGPELEIDTANFWSFFWIWYNLIQQLSLFLPI